MSEDRETARFFNTESRRGLIWRTAEGLHEFPWAACMRNADRYGSAYMCKGRTIETLIQPAGEYKLYKQRQRAALDKSAYGRPDLHVAPTSFSPQAWLLMS